MNKTISFILLLLLTIFSCKSSYSPQTYSITKDLKDDKAMVISAHPFASTVGLEIIRNGGNAIDAAIAVQFALAVCYPTAGNIGGGGFMVFRGNDGSISCLDFREMAPKAATADMYLDDSGEIVPNLSIDGHLAVGIPGSVDGLWTAYQKYSKLKDWKALIQPAINAAKFGILLTAREANGLNNNRSAFEKMNNRKIPFTFKPEWKEGDILIQKELANTLESIRDNGRDGFYKGKVAATLVAEINKGKGIITMEDLANYKSIWRTPIQFHYKGHEIISMPPPSSGGIALLQLMKMVEPFDISSMGFHKATTAHLIIEAEKRVYADRSQHLGDSDFFKVPIKTLTSDAYIRMRMADFNPNAATSNGNIHPGAIHESEETTHLCIVDDEGNAVSITTTLNNSYGSKVVVEGGGYLLNDEMDDFSAKAGVPNIYGLIGAEANKIEPGKRMLSSMTPSIVTKNGKLKAVIGTPGGSTIITSVFQTIVNIIDYDMNAYEAVSSPRFHHQWVPEEVFYEKDCFSPDVMAALINKGHPLKERGAIGRVEAILIDSNGSVSGGADPRGDDDAKGF